MERAQLIALLRATGCAEERGGFVFLRDARWTSDEQAQFAALTSNLEHRTSNIELGWLGIRTGGSGGAMKFARHDEKTLSAAVRGFCAHFGIERVNAVDVLPAHHVSGLMARVRCAATGGTHVASEWRRLEAGDRPELPGGGDWVLSLVPTQLQRLVGAPETAAWLRGFKVILLGGGPVWPALAEAAAQAELPIALSYGMTETAAMVAAQRPGEFLAGDRSCGCALPHARFEVDAEDRVVVAGDSVFRGYYPAWSDARTHVTDDLGRIDEHGRLHVLGRRDAAIITGGKKVLPAAVEAALRASGEFEDVAVIGVPDPTWGEAVVACYPTGGRVPDRVRAVASLAPHERPKRFVAVAAWPRNAAGKVDRARLRQAAIAATSAPEPK